MRKIKECLKGLAQKNVDMSVNRIIKEICEIDDDQLEYKLANGIKLDGQMINLYFYRNMGFKCNNIWVEKYGQLPLCNYIEKTLNQLYKSDPPAKKKRTEFPFIFDHTLYRIPTDEELKEFENYPDLSSKQILDEFSYIIIGRGILDGKNKKLIIECVQKLIDLYPEDNRYKGAMRLAHELQPRFL